MSRDYYKLEPDKVHLLRQNPPLHFTRGRAGAGIQFITRHHLMYVGEVEAVVNNIWSTRRASAHIVIGPRGRWGQAVWDRDTAWANANAWANARTIAIEHSNNTGRFGGNDYHDKSWNISDETIISGARVSAAYCLDEKLGKPVYGTNIRDHNQFTSTGCPVHLQGPRPGNAWGGRAGKYHYQWMEEATWFYDQLDKKLVHPDGTPISIKFPAPSKEEGLFVSLSQERQEDLARKIDRIHHELTYPFQSRYDDPETGEKSNFKETLVGYTLEADKKLEHMNQVELPSIRKAIEGESPDTDGLPEDA